MATKLTSENFESEIANNSVALVDFWAEWCGPCRAIGPIIEELATELTGKALIAKVNVDEEKDLSKGHGVMSIPTMIIFKNGEEVDRLIGTRPKEELIEAITKHF